MKIQFLTKTNSDGKTEAAGKTYTLDDDKAKVYIEKGLAVEVSKSTDEIAAEESAKKAAEEGAKKAADESEKKAAEEAAKKAEKDAVKAAKEAEKKAAVQNK